MSILNPARLRSEVEARETRKLKVFEHILEMCHNKIIITNQQTDNCYCIFTCPSVVFGLPLFNLMDCIRFIMVKLVDKGFEVHLAVPNNIFISWKKDSNSDYSRKIYQLETSTNSLYNNGTTISNKLSIMPTIRSNSSISSFKHSRNKSDSNEDTNEYKLFSNKPANKKEKHYRPIEDYQQTSTQSSIDGYSIDDIDYLHCKLDELLA